MIKVSAFLGSPRKNGNTHILLTKFLEGARSQGAKTDLVFLSELEIKGCDGCHACWKGKKCPKNDDMVEQYKSIIDSDLIVFGTPVYWFGPTAIMKAFIDRFVYFNCPRNRSKIRGKPAAIIVPFEDEDIKTAKFIVEFFKKSLAYLEMKLAGQIIAPGVGDKGAILKYPDKLTESFLLGQRLVRNLM